MSSPYPTHIEVPVRYTPTAELSHSQLMKLYQLGIPVIEDLSWEDVSANSNVKLKEYSKLYGARAEGLRLPRSRAEVEIFFTALLHARYTTASSVSHHWQVQKSEDALHNQSKVHPYVRELALENGLAFHLAQRYGIETIANVVQFISDQEGEWTDDNKALSAALIVEEIANVAETKVKEVVGTDGIMADVMTTLSGSGPWKGWCGFKSGFRAE